MKELEIKTTNLQLTQAQEKMFYLNIGQIIATHFDDPENLKMFESKKEIYAQKMKQLERN